jgi:hypothetical protein
MPEDSRWDLTRRLKSLVMLYPGALSLKERGIYTKHCRRKPRKYL